MKSVARLLQSNFLIEARYESQVSCVMGCTGRHPMACDRNAIAERIRGALRQNPRLTLEAVAAALDIGRHTARRALSAVFGKSFRDLQRDAIAEAVKAKLEQQPASSVKEIAFEMGYEHARSLSRRWRRIAGVTLRESKRESVDE
jgi:AraC-like DNA-binding protein